MEPKKLCRSTSNKMIAGVCGGIAEYLNLDPTVIRLVWAAFCLAGGTGILAYIVAAIIMPEQ
ncbi:MAG: PspC domain-containing protein [Lachnoclostridium sp.]|jgi:phage shock protein C